MEFNEFRSDLDKNLQEALRDIMEDSKSTKKTKKPTMAENQKDIDQLRDCVFMLSVIVQKLCIYQMKNSLTLGRDSSQLTDMTSMINSINEMVAETFPDFIDIEDLNAKD